MASISGSEPEDQHDGDLKRAADDFEAFRPLKRQKGALNGDYLDLLNNEIRDAASRVDSYHQHTEQLTSSQFGLTSWTKVEKELLFETITRVGRDNTCRIAETIGTKGEIEVEAFIQALENSKSQRDSAGNRQLVAKAEHPAALELSQQCCHALDEAADALSLRQERKEQKREESLWGETWDLTPDIARRLERGDEDLDVTQMPSIKLFKLRNWLKLSQSMFMNSSIPGDNWNHVDNKPPSIWATTLEDFYSLTLSITKRIVQTAIFTASSRIRAQQEYRPETKNAIGRADVAAALASLNMPTNSREFWRKSSRRLRIDVYDEDDSDEEAGPMDPRDVEIALEGNEEPDSGEDDNIEPQHLELSDEDSEEGESTSSESSSPDDNEVTKKAALVERRSIKEEASEVFLFSAATYSETRRLQQALEHRIAVERQQERLAEEVDQQASLEEEAEMWKLLQKPPPLELPRLPSVSRPQKSVMDVESMFPLGRNWRSNIQYREQWEDAAQRHRD